MNNKDSFCVVTVVTEYYIPGALVTLYSFQRCNRWFNGDFIVLHDGLNQTQQKIFKEIFSNIKFVQVSNRLSNWIKGMIQIRPELADQYSQFISLDVLQFDGYEKVLLLDSDLLFRHDISEICGREEPLLCCRDRPAYLGYGRNRATYETTKDKKNVIVDTFNSGFMLIDQKLLNHVEYNRLLEIISQDQWRQITAAHTDQLIFNLAFEGRQYLLDGSYNFLLKHERIIENVEGISTSDAKVVHFNLHVKPWQIDKLLGCSFDNPIVLKAFEWWSETFIECLQLRALRGRVKAN